MSARAVRPLGKVPVDHPKERGQRKAFVVTSRQEKEKHPNAECEDDAALWQTEDPSHGGKRVAVVDDTDLFWHGDAARHLPDRGHGCFGGRSSE